MPEYKFEHDHFLNETSRSRVMISMHPVLPDSVKRHPKPISLGLGEPYYELQPITSLQVKLVDNQEALISRLDKNDKQMNLAESLSYGEMTGFKELWTNIREFVCDMGNQPAYSDWGIHPSFGRSNGLFRIMQTFINPGDVVLVEEFVSERSLSIISHAGGILVPLKFDSSSGITPNLFLSILRNWEQTHSSTKFPKILLTTPSGPEPTGVTQSLEVRQEIYDICEKFNLLIVEDDPSSYISLQNFSSVSEYKSTLTKSYLSLDTSGRVLRIESFSTYFGPGLRLGYIICHNRFIDFLKVFSEIVNDAPLGPTQLLVNNTILLMGGWENWLMSLSRKYNARKELVREELGQKSKITVTIPKTGTCLGLTMNGTSIKSFVEKCHRNGLLMRICTSVLGKEIIKISLADGNDEEFTSAVMRLNSLI